MATIRSRIGESMINHIILAFFTLSGFGFWFSQLLKLTDWLLKKFEEWQNK